MAVLPDMGVSLREVTLTLPSAGCLPVQHPHELPLLQRLVDEAAVSANRMGNVAGAH